MTTIVRDLAAFLDDPDDTILVYDMKHELAECPQLQAEVLDYERRVDAASRDEPCTTLLKFDAALALHVPPMQYPPTWLVPPPGKARPRDAHLVPGDASQRLIELLCTKTSRNVADAIATCPLFAGLSATRTGVFMAGGLPVALATESQAGRPAFSDIDWFIRCHGERSVNRVRDEWVGWVNSVLQQEVDAAVDAYVAVDREERGLLRENSKGFRTGRDDIVFTTIVCVTSRRAINAWVRTPVGTLEMQLVLDAQHQIGSTLYGFDIKMCQVAYDGTELLMTPDFVRTLRRGYEVIEPAKDRGGRYSRRLLKYMVRYNMGAVIPGWDPRLLDALAITAHTSRSKLRCFASQLPGRGATFAILYKGFERLGKYMLEAEDDGYDFDDGRKSEPVDATARFLERKFPVPYAYGMDASLRRICTCPWFDGVTIAYALRTLRDEVLFTDPNFA